MGASGSRVSPAMAPPSTSPFPTATSQRQPRAVGDAVQVDLLIVERPDQVVDVGGRPHARRGRPSPFPWDRFPISGCHARRVGPVMNKCPCSIREMGGHGHLARESLLSHDAAWHAYLAPSGITGRMLRPPKRLANTPSTAV